VCGGVLDEKKREKRGEAGREATYTLAGRQVLLEFNVLTETFRDSHHNCIALNYYQALQVLQWALHSCD